MLRIKGHFQNERGNITLLVMASLLLIIILGVLFVNFGSVLATKEQSATTAKQASLAATSTLYDEVRIAIFKYYDETDWDDGDEDDEDEDNEDNEDEDEEDPVEEFFKDFDENVQEKKESFSWFTTLGWSENEIEIEALNKVIMKGLSDPLIKSKLKPLISSDEVRYKVRNKAQQVILDNGGTLDGAELRIEEEQIEIKAANEFTSTSYKNFLNGINEDIYQEYKGPEIEILNVVFPNNGTYNLEYLDPPNPGI